MTLKVEQSSSRFGLLHTWTETLKASLPGRAGCMLALQAKDPRNHPWTLHATVRLEALQGGPENPSARSSDVFPCSPAVAFQIRRRFVVQWVRTGCVWRPFTKVCGPATFLFGDAASKSSSSKQEGVAEPVVWLLLDPTPETLNLTMNFNEWTPSMANLCKKNVSTTPSKRKSPSALSPANVLKMDFASCRLTRGVLCRKRVCSPACAGLLLHNGYRQQCSLPQYCPFVYPRL